jgi:hypothetical protein
MTLAPREMRQQPETRVMRQSGRIQPRDNLVRAVDPDIEQTGRLQQ